MNPVCGIVTTPPNSSSSNLLQWDAPERVPGCDVCHNTIQVSDEQWKYLAAMHPDQRLRSLALRLLDTAQAPHSQNSALNHFEPSSNQRTQRMKNGSRRWPKSQLAEGTLSDLESGESASGEEPGNRGT